MQKINILLIEDEEFDALRVKRTIALQPDMMEISQVVSDGSSALELVEEDPNRFDIVIMDFHIAGGIMGEELIVEIKKRSPCIQIIVITKLTVNDYRFEFASSLLKIGAYWYCTKYPTHIAEFIYQPTDFLISIHNAYQKKLLELKSFEYNKKMSSNISSIMESKKIIGSSAKMRSLNELIMKHASHDMNILIYGESGTGKELVAYNIHYNSSRRFENFVRINCSSIPSDLIESELFGYEKFAFTGAQKDKKGLFEIAHKGTILLDEITELPLQAQSKLLRVLQEGEIEKIGRSRTQKVDVRVIASSNKRLEDEVNQKRFREDLYFRLNVIPIVVPPLRERKEDIVELMDFFNSKSSQSLSLKRPVFTEEAIEEILNYNWPGNIRELKNFVQRMQFIDCNFITRDIVRMSMNSLLSVISENSGEKILDQYFDKNNIIALSSFEKLAKSRYIQFVRDNSSSDSHAAKQLGLAQPNLCRICKDLNLR